MATRRSSVVFLGDDAQLNATLARIEGKLRALTATAEEENAKQVAAADAAGKKFGSAFEQGTNRAGSALTKLGSTLGNWGVPFSGSLEKMGKQFDEATSKSQKFASAMASAGKLTLGAGVAGFAAAAFEGVKGAAALQKQMEMLHTQAGATQAQVGQLTKGVLNMAGSVGTGPQTLAQGMYHVVSSLNATLPAATRASTEMNVLRIAAEGAKVGNANLVDVTNALDAAVVSGVNGVQNFGQAMGVMNATVGAGDMTMQDLADAFGTGLLAKAKTAGLSIRDVGAAAAVLGDNNIRGAEAGTLLGSTFRIMSAPAAAAAKALGAVNLGALQLANDMRTGGLIKALTDLKAHLVDSGATASQQALVLERAFGGRQSTGVQVLLGQLDRLKAKYADVSSGGKNFGKDYQGTTHTLSFQTDQLKATVQALADKFDLFLIPKLEAVGHAVSDVIGWFEKHKAAAQVLAGVITGVLGAAVGLFVAQKMAAFVSWMGQGVSAIGKFATSVLQGAGTLISKFTAIGAGAEMMETEVATASAGAGEQMTLFGSEVAAATQEASGQFAALGAEVGAVSTEVVASAETAAAGVDAALGSTGVGLIVIGLGVAVVELSTHWQQAMTAITDAAKTMYTVVRATLQPLIFAINQVSSGLNTITGGLVGGGQVGLPTANQLFGGGGGGHGGNALSRALTQGMASIKNPGAKGLTTGSFNTNSFAAAVLAGLGAPQTARNLDALVGWIQREGNNPNIDKHNPLDTTLPEKGSYPTNPQGVQSFPTWAAGLKATISTLQQQNMGAILASLKAGLGLSGPGVSAALSAWSGPGGYSSTPMAHLGNAAIQRLLSGTSAAKGVRSLLYANPLQGDMYSVERTDQGKDYGDIRGNIGAIGAGIVTLAQNLQGFGQTIVEKLTQGPNKGQEVYYAYETGATGVGIRQGQTLRAGQTIGRGLGTGGVEFGFWNPKTGRSEGAPYFSGANATPPGEAFAQWMAQLSHGGIYTTTKGGVTTGGGLNVGYSVAQLEQAFVKALVTAGDSLLTKLGNVIQSGTVRTLSSALGASTGGATSAQLNRIIESLGPSATLAQIGGPGAPDTAGFAKTLSGDLGKIHAAGLTQLDHDLGVKHGTALSQLVADLTALHGTALTKIEGTLAASHSRPMQQLGRDLKAGPGSLPSITSVLAKGIDASQQGKQFEMLIASLVASGQTQLAARLVSEHKAAIATLAQEMYAEQVMKDGESLNLQATMLRDQTQLQANADAAQLNVVKAQDQAVTDAMNALVTSTRDMTQIITDRFAAMAQQVEDSMQAMADAANAVVTGINDQTQIQVDVLGERGLYGLNLIAQRLQVQADQTKAYWDQQIALAQQNLDTVTAQWHTAITAAQLNLDQVTLSQDQYVAQQQQADDTTKIAQLGLIATAQAHSDAVTLHEDTAIVGPAQIAVDLGATLPKAQQDVLNAQLRRAQGQAGVAEGQAGGALETVTASANSAMQAADTAYANAQASAALVIGNANQTLAAVQGEATLMIDNAKQTLQTTQDSATIAEAGADSAVAIMKQTASTEFAGSGATINIYGLPANDAAAIGDEVQWAARTLIPAF